MKKTIATFFLSILFVFSLSLSKTPHSNENHAINDSVKQRSQFVRIVFYNTENLYDPYDDTTKLDDEFTREGLKHWSYSKFRIKLNHLYKTLMAAGGWEPPSIIGFCEVENRYVLNKLLFETPFKKYGYRIIHHDSPDLRGVDVAMIYRPDRFCLIRSMAVAIRFPFDTLVQTREILLVEGTVFGRDTIRLLVNHWPSRLGGYTESQPRRLYVAGVVKKIVDSLFSRDASAKIVIMGDFNDEPDSEAIAGTLQAGANDQDAGKPGLVNLMFRFLESGQGSHKYQGKWAILDQFIVSDALLQKDEPVFTTLEDVHIFKGDFLMEKDDRFFGDKPLRTYSGPRYVGGFSDHMPIYLDIRQGKE